MKNRQVIVVDHDPAWAQEFTREADRIRAALAPLEHQVHHIGSTAVPGLAAKPIIDIMLAVPDLPALDERTHIDSSPSATRRSASTAFPADATSSRAPAFARTTSTPSRAAMRA